MRDYTKISCGVTGQAVIPTDKVEQVKHKIYTEIHNTLNAGYWHFFVGLTGESSLLFMETVLPVKEQYPDIIIEAMLPYKGWIEEQTEKERYLHALGQLNGINVCSDQNYGDSVYIVNNQLLDINNRLIAIYDGHDSNTKDIVDRAKEVEHEVREIWI